MNIGHLYDQTVAPHYDRDEFGLLSGARSLALEQIAAHLPPGDVSAVLDLAAGTGESLVALKSLYPEAALHGIDLSDQMLALAQTKLAFHAIHDDVAHAGRHFTAASIDLIVMHFLTTFIDGDAVAADTARLLKPGGCYSIVSTTYDAFSRIHELGLKVVPEDFIRDVAPAPLNGEAVAAYLRNAGLEVVAIAEFEKTLHFADFPSLYDFGLKSGFFTHILAKTDADRVAEFARLAGAFPMEDRYKAAIVLARKPETIRN